MAREFFSQHALDVAPSLLGARISVSTEQGTVTIRISEVEAYHGVGTPGPYDAGSHSRDRRTERNASMFGPPGHAYVYFTYGMHFALNLVCSPEGIASGVLLRSGEIVEGEDIAEERRLRRQPRNSRLTSIPHRQLARGPGNLAAALGITRAEHDGSDLYAQPFRFDSQRGEPLEISKGPRVGVGGEAGSAAFPWRFWVSGDPTVSAYRPGRDVPGTVTNPARRDAQP